MVCCKWIIQYTTLIKCIFCWWTCTDYVNIFNFINSKRTRNNIQSLNYITFTRVLFWLVTDVHFIFYEFEYDIITGNVVAMLVRRSQKQSLTFTFFLILHPRKLIWGKKEGHSIWLYNFSITDPRIWYYNINLPPGIRFIST